MRKFQHSKQKSFLDSSNGHEESSFLLKIICADGVVVSDRLVFILWSKQFRHLWMLSHFCHFWMLSQSYHLSMLPQIYVLSCTPLDAFPILRPLTSHLKKKLYLWEAKERKEIHSKLWETILVNFASPLSSTSKLKIGILRIVTNL